MNDRLHNTLFYCLAAFIGVLLHYWFKTAPDDILKILLYPHAKITEVFYNASLSYMRGVGYSSIDGLFIIGRECMGVKFILILFGMTACTFASHFAGFRKVTWFITSLIGSIAVGMFISCIRILGSVPFAAHPKFALFHSSIGVSLYFFVLIVSYTVLNKFVRSEKNEEGT